MSLFYCCLSALASPAIKPKSDIMEEPNASLKPLVRACCRDCVTFAYHFADFVHFEDGVFDITTSQNGLATEVNDEFNYP